MAHEMSSSSTRWRMLLAPWRDAAASLGQLQRAPTQRGAGVAEDGVVWLLWDAKHDDDDADGDAETLQRELELMELLDLVARVDRTVFEEFVLVVCGRVEGAQLLHSTRSDDDDAVRHFRFAYHIHVTSRAMLSSSLAIQRLVMGYSEVESSTAFREVKRALEDALEDATGEPFRRLHDPIAVRLGCAQRPQCDAAWLFALAQLAALQASMAPAQDDSDVRPQSVIPLSRKASAFRIRSVLISLVDEPEPATLVVTSLSRIAQLGIEISFLRISTIYFSSVDPAVLTLSLHELFAPSQNPSFRPPGSGSHVRGVRHLEMDVFIEYWSFRRLCSAIAHSRSLRTLTFFESDIGLDDRINTEGFHEQLFSRIQWLGFALFSPYATHAVQTVQFPASASFVEWPDAMAAVAAFPFPVNYLGMAFDNARENTFVDVPCQTNVCLRRPDGRCMATSSTDAACISFPEGLDHVYVLGHDSGLQTEWLTVLLPGWGEAWVDAAAVKVHGAEPSPGRDDARGIPRVVLTSAFPSAVDIIARMFRNLGSRTVALDIDASGYRYSIETLTTLLSAFPALAHLHLNNVVLESISPIFDGYTTTGNSRLERLELRHVDLPHGDFQESMVLKLRNRFHPCWNSLRELCVQQVREPSASGGSQELDQDWSTLLQDCPRLCRLDVIVRSRRLGSLSTEIQRFEVLHGKPTNVRKAPLAMASKLAFLNVVRRSQSSTAQAMASDSIASIFQFAAPTISRRCAIHVCTRGSDGDQG